MFDIRLLNKIGFFSDFDQAEKTEISALKDAVFRKYDPNEPIINEGDEGDSFFVMLKGVANVYKKPNVNPISTLNPGGVFGEISFLSPRIRTASVSAIDTCIVLEFGQTIGEHLSFPVYDKLKNKLIALLISHLDDIIELRTKDHFATDKDNPFEEGERMKGMEQKIKIFSDKGYSIFSLGNMEALLENEVEGTSKKVNMVELSSTLPQKYINFVKENLQDPSDYLFAKTDDYSGYIIPKAAQSVWRSTLTADRAKELAKSRAVQMYQKLDNIY